MTLNELPLIRLELNWCINVLRPKRLRNHNLWGGKYLPSLYRGDVFPEPSNELMTNCLSTTAQEKDFTDSYMPFVKDKWSVKNH